MIDIKLIRENRDLVKENIKKKFQDEKLPLVDEVYEMDKRVREVQVKADGLKADKNKSSSEDGHMKTIVNIEGMCCDHCAKRVEGALSAVQPCVNDSILLLYFEYIFSIFVAVLSFGLKRLHLIDKHTEGLLCLFMRI